MICVEYAICSIEYQNALDLYRDILREQEALFTETQPKSFRYDTDKVQSMPSNPLEKYIERREERQIDERLEQATKLINDRELLMRAKRRELIESHATHDLIYRYKYIDLISIDHIAEMLGYSRSQVYRVLAKIQKSLKEGTQCDKV